MAGRYSAFQLFWIRAESHIVLRNISVEEVRQEEIPGQEIDDIDVEESQDNEGGEE